MFDPGNTNAMNYVLQKNQKELFKKFYQVDATLTRERGGRGLGLAIVKESLIITVENYV